MHREREHRGRDGFEKVARKEDEARECRRREDHPEPKRLHRDAAQIDRADTADHDREPRAPPGQPSRVRDHADHHLPMLMDPEGPFALATEGDENLSRKGDPLPYVAPPPGMFPDVRD